jgi:hypothetical protein
MHKSRGFKARMSKSKTRVLYKITNEIKKNTEKHLEHSKRKEIDIYSQL